MKNLTTIIILLVAAGCSSQDRKLTEEEKKIVGTYEAKKEETTVKLVLLENGKSEHWVNGEKKGEATWKLVEKEVHVPGRKRLFFGMVKTQEFTKLNQTVI